MVVWKFRNKRTDKQDTMTQYSKFFVLLVSLPHRSQITAQNYSPLLQTLLCWSMKRFFCHSFEFNPSYFHLTTDRSWYNLFNSITIWLYQNCTSSNPSFSCHLPNKYLFLLSWKFSGSLNKYSLWTQDCLSFITYRILCTVLKKTAERRK